ncbi:Ldh family oxidoreductase [Candidatus Bipolaricaulota bacterium]|nr:Ldh family oxidoreductase [Candidatus Bipolaricaulota bacterium]
MNSTKVSVQGLARFVTACFTSLGVSEEDARITADVLIEADRRGIASHGVARLKRYTDGIATGVILPETRYKVLRETANTLLVTGGNGLGQPVSHRAMRSVIDKAKEKDVALAAVRDSNHYGIAGYYAMMALTDGLIGLSASNAFPLVVPTFSKDALLGTNPIAVAAPTSGAMPFVLDMATSTVTRGKLEEYNRHGMPIPPVWGTDAHGSPTTDAAAVLKDVVARRGGGLLPLGGAGEETGGHKGFGLAMLVEILTGILSGGAFGPHVYGRPNAPANVCHFFAAIRIEAFIPLDEFTAALAAFVELLHGSEKAKGYDRSYVHGEKEFQRAKEQQEHVQIADKVVSEIERIGKGLGVTADF